MKKEILRRLPAVHRVLDAASDEGLVSRFGHDAVAGAIQTTMADLRQQVQAGTALDETVMQVGSVVRQVAEQLEQAASPNLKPAINATGILLHTGLGRAAMPAAARAAATSVMGCCNLQMDLTDGARLHREHVIKALVCELTGAEDVLLVNNNAAATMLVLRALAKGKEVIVSRGELIEIGGSFRLPDIMSESGAILREVGTTNKTHLRDYMKAITAETAMMLKVHKSNYDIVGFTKEVSLAELVALGQTHHVPVLDDLGCGAMIGLEAFGLGHEMTMRESLAAGADLVLASTDKLIGGPQGGLIIGKRGLIDQVRSHPLYRALRVCKMTLAALEATLRLFRNPARLTQVHPLYRMLARTPEELFQQATRVAEEIRTFTSDPVCVVEHAAYLGGGALPGQTLASFAVRIDVRDNGAAALARKFREADFPVVPRVHRQALHLDMRTVLPEECESLLATLRAVLNVQS